MIALVTEEEARNAARWITEWATDYRGEVPGRIHASSHGQHYGLGSAPPFAPEFISYIGKINCKNDRCRQCREDLPIYIEGAEYRAKHSDPRTKVTRAFRKLRRAAPLEFDVLYMAVMHGLSITEIAEKLTERARTKGLDETYDVAAVTVLAVLGVDKVGAWM